MRADRLEELRQRLRQTSDPTFWMKVEELRDLVDNYVPSPRCGHVVTAVQDGLRRTVTAECYLAQGHLGACIGYARLDPLGKLFLVTDEMAEKIIEVLDLIV